MRNQSCFSNTGSIIRLFFISFLVCALFGSAITVMADDRTYLWQSRDQFVALETRDNGSDTTNAHPVEISSDLLDALFASIEVRSEGAKHNEPLFTPASLHVLTPEIRKALQTSTSKHDVTFAVIGLYKAAWGFAKTPKVTTGRVFYQDGTLNLIIGQVQQDVNEREDRRLAPFVPGSRKQVSSGSWELFPSSGQESFKLKRKDWIVFSTHYRTAPPMKSEVMQTAPVMQAPATATQPQTQRAESRNPIERLTVLHELKSKGLISEEEFQGKRQQILNGL